MIILSLHDVATGRALLIRRYPQEGDPKMLNNQRKRDDDDHNFDERGVLKDGRRMRVPMSAMDGQQQELSRHAHHLHDGSGNYHLIHHQPGFIVSDAVTPEERQRVSDARDEYERELTTAWQRGAN